MEVNSTEALKGKEAKMKEVRYGKIAHYVRKSVWTWLKGENCSFFSKLLAKGCWGTALSLKRLPKVMSSLLLLPLVRLLAHHFFAVVSPCK